MSYVHKIPSVDKVTHGSETTIISGLRLAFSLIIKVVERGVLDVRRARIM